MNLAKVPGVAQVTHRYCPPFTRAWSKIMILALLLYFKKSKQFWPISSPPPMGSLKCWPICSSRLFHANIYIIIKKSFIIKRKNILVNLWHTNCAEYTFYFSKFIFKQLIKLSDLMSSSFSKVVWVSL